jgi:hypothetical protein
MVRGPAHTAVPALACAIRGTRRRAILPRPMREPNLRMRSLAALLACLWTSLASAVIVAYRPGGPADPVLGASVLLPALVAGAAVVWPPAAEGYRSRLAILWVGICSALLIVPLLVEVSQRSVAAPIAGVPQTLSPSGETAYAGILALATTCLYGSLGLARRVLDRRSVAWSDVDRRSLVAGVGVAAASTVLGAALFGTAALANGSALQETRPAAQDRAWGPTDLSLTPPPCAALPELGATARVEAAGEALVDGAVMARATLHGVRSGGDERWQGSLEGRFGMQDARFTLTASGAVLSIDGGGWAEPPLGPDGDGHPNGDPSDGTLDGAVARSLMVHGPQAAEDIGIELVGGVNARHCRAAVDGPSVLDAFVPARWLAARDLRRVPPPLVDWRGEVDWWVFADGQLGLASVVVGGYPGDAWPVGGLQATLQARLSALDRGRPQAVDAPQP